MSAEDPRLTAVLPLLSKQVDVFELVAALHQHKDVGVQDALCSKLYEAKSHEIEFFLPQLWYARGKLVAKAPPIKRSSYLSPLVFPGGMLHYEWALLYII